MKTFRLLTPKEQRMLLEMVEGAKPKKGQPGDERSGEQLEALREWNRLSRPARQR
jgi:hypothetical protein